LCLASGGDIFLNEKYRRQMEEGQKGKRNVFELDELFRSEKTCLLKVIQTYSLLLGERPEIAEEVQAIRGLLGVEGGLPVETIKAEVDKLKGKLLGTGMAGKTAGQGIAPNEIGLLKAKVTESCGLFRKVMNAVIEDFYPLDKGLEEKATAIQLDCRQEPTQIDLKPVSDRFLGFISGLSAKVSEDFRTVNKTFILLVEHIKELEKGLTEELGGEERIKEIEYFEMKINDEVGSIVNSFDIHATIQEVKSFVIERIANIKRALALRKQQELQRATIAQESISKLQQRISEAERDAAEMSRKAELLEMVAMKDSLTGLYSRQAFEMRLKGSLDSMARGGSDFVLILFDVDKFKDINDQLGHVAGDKVLQKVAQCLKLTFRERDFIARYSGDEFVAMIERLPEEMAREKVLAFKKILAKRRFVSQKSGPVKVKVSAGIAISMSGDTPEALIERADRAMYDAKHGLLVVADQ
jgi:diguanylate cyclase (GGDEF)-like protein